MRRIRPIRIDIYEFDRPSFRGKRLLRDYRCSPENLQSVADFLTANLDFPIDIAIIRQEASRGKHPLLLEYREGYKELA